MVLYSNVTWVKEGALYAVQLGKAFETAKSGITGLGASQRHVS
jgi:hypothetical protein